MTRTIRLIGDRITLRPLERSDDSWFFELNEDPEVIRYTGDSPFASVQDATTFLSNYTDQFEPGFGRMAVELKSTGEAIGWCGLKPHEDFVDLGYRFFRKHWGKGYATEASLLSLRFGFEQLGLEVITGRVMPENTASIKVLEKIGMTKTGTGPCGHAENVLYFTIEKWQHQARSNG